jgi:hypothetical protein
LKKLIVSIIAVIVLAGIAIMVVHKSPVKTNAGNTTGNTAYTVTNACDVLTSSSAQQLFASAAVKGTTPGGGESTSDIAFSECIYMTEPNIDPPHVVSVAIRSAKDSAGAASNKSVFTPSGEPTGVQKVTGYGSSAYWDPSMGQLNILKGNDWYIVSNYTGTSPANGTATLTMAEQLSQQLKLQ